MSFFWLALTIVAQQNTTYTLSVKAEQPRVIHVEAVLHVPDDTLRMTESMYEQLPDGAATFVRNLHARAQREIAVKYLGQSRWLLSSHTNGPVSLSYDVDIQHDTVRWKTSAAFARAYAVEGASIFAGGAVFIVSSAVDTVDVRFKLPSSWTVTSSYRPMGKNAFRVVGLNDLFSNINAVGVLSTRSITSGSLSVEFGAAPGIGETVSRYSDAISPVIEHFRRITGGAPEGRIVVVAGLSPLADGGEAFNQSISIMQRAQPGDDNRTRWAYLMAHEIFHLWDGKAIRAANKVDVEWFVEGFTDYMAKQAVFKTGLITHEQLLERVKIDYDRYAGRVGQASLRAAGQHKGSNVPFLYCGGMSFAALLDKTMRANGRGSVDEIFRVMYQRFGVTHKTYTYDDLVRVTNEVAGADLSELFNRYVSGTEKIPFESVTPAF